MSDLELTYKVNNDLLLCIKVTPMQCGCVKYLLLLFLFCCLYTHIYWMSVHLGRGIPPLLLFLMVSSNFGSVICDTGLYK